MSAFDQAIASISGALIASEMGRLVTYRQTASGAFELRAVVTKGARFEDTRRGLFASVLVKLDSFDISPADGDEVVIGDDICRVVEVVPDGFGAASLHVRFVRKFQA